MTTAEMLQRQNSMYGMSLKQVMTNVKNSLDFKLDGFEKSKTSLATSLLSDVQELMNIGGAANLETARQYCNMVKRLLNTSEAEFNEILGSK